MKFPNILKKQHRHNKKYTPLKRNPSDWYIFHRIVIYGNFDPKQLPWKIDQIKNSRERCFPLPGTGRKAGLARKGFVSNRKEGTWVKAFLWSKKRTAPEGSLAGSHEGAKRAAMTYSFLGTCKINNVEPFSRLKDVLTRIPDHSIKRLDELLPANRIEKSSWF